jgi:hypothetical protein
MNSAKCLNISRHGRACPGHPRLAEFRYGRRVYLSSDKSSERRSLRRVTNDLVRRIFEHRSGFVEGFTKRHGLKKLVLFREI